MARGKGHHNLLKGANIPWSDLRKKEYETYDHSVYINYPYLIEAAREMALPKNPSKVLVAGDFHGDLKHLDAVANHARREGISVIVNVGDFGYWPHTDRDMIRSADRILVRNGVHLIFIDGNHENFAALYAPHPQHEAFRVIGKRILHAPRGSSWMWQGKKIVALGGGASIDRASRLLEESKRRKSHQKNRWYWWPEEQLHEDDIAHAGENERCDIIFTHDSPMSVQMPFEDDLKSDHFESNQNRRLLQDAVQKLRPDLLFHGHYHRRYTGEGGGFDWSFVSEGLDCNVQRKKEQTWTVLDLENR